MSELKLPVKFDEDFDLVDADGFPLLWGADMIDHNPDIGVEIAKRVNNHKRLVEALRSIQNDIAETGDVSDESCDMMDTVISDLATLEAEKGGEL